jgi:hypothetical protein
VGVGPTGDDRVLRGGSWNSNARNVRAANRNHDHPGNRNDNVGCRLSRAHPPAGRPAPDPTGTPSGRDGARGENQSATGAPVGAQRVRERAPVDSLQQ